MRGSIRVGKLFGIPLFIHYTWFVIVALITISFATVNYPREYPGWPAASYWLAGLLTALLLFASVLIHELSHSLVSRAQGVPVDSITLFIFGGVANIREEPRKARHELLMAAAGPASSLLLALLLGIVALVAPARSFVAGLARTLALINLWVGLFNLIPGFPLDGGRVLRSLIWWGSNDIVQSTRIASIIGRVIATLMIISGFLVAIFLGDWVSGLWLVFIGWFLDNAAVQSYQQLLLREALAGVTARQLMSPLCPTIEDDPDLQTVVDEFVLGTGQRCLFISRGNRLAGLLTLHHIKSVPKERWRETRVSEVMTPSSEIKSVDINQSGLNILRTMDEANVNQIPVVDGERMVGIITREHLLHYIRNRIELGL
jgi:Zn-dependent protease